LDQHADVACACFASPPVCLSLPSRSELSGGVRGFGGHSQPLGAFPERRPSCWLLAGWPLKR
jgi:hypothetical protein